MLAISLGFSRPWAVRATSESASLGHMKVISVDPEVMHGTPCFNGTRVPIEYVFSYLPDRLQEFLANYPTVERKQVNELMHQLPQILAQVPPHVLSSVA